MLTLRKARAGDERAVLDLVASVLCEFGFEVEPGGADADLSDIQKSYHEGGGLFLVVVDEDDTIAGCGGLCARSGGEAELRKIYFAPGIRGRGLGRRLLEQIVEHARKQGFRRIVLETASRLTAAGKLYRSLGFVEVERPHMRERCDLALTLELVGAAPFAIRAAEAVDIPLIARHRAGMFRDMGQLDESRSASLVQTTITFLEDAMPRGEYVGWLATPKAEPDRVIGGAGAQLRRVLPFPQPGSPGPGIAAGRQAIVLNVYTEPEWRRRGVARALMEAVVTWARASELDSLVLHASADGRALYEAMGFAPTNEMRFISLRSPNSG